MLQKMQLTCVSIDREKFHLNGNEVDYFNFPNWTKRIIYLLKSYLLWLQIQYIFINTFYLAFVIPIPHTTTMVYVVIYSDL